MKLIYLLLILFLLPVLSVWGEVGRENNNNAGSAVSGRSQAQRPSPPVSRQAVVINMNGGYSGGYNQNFPDYSVPPPSFQPSYGQLNWSGQALNPPSDQNGFPNPGEGVFQNTEQPNEASSPASAGVRTAMAIHHHPYTPGYVRKRLQRIGVTSEPSLITNRKEIIDTDKNHSMIRFPQKDSRQVVIAAQVVLPGELGGSLVRHQMTLLESSAWRSQVRKWDVQETHRNHYYWHAGVGFDYCHFRDSLGYQWYGWYIGSEYFWTRHFDGRWWWYDPNDNRWCFWNSGFWWWQDPYHVADLYCYDNGNYIPCNSANDQVEVTAPGGLAAQSYLSPDGTRMVKVDSNTKDAFLYDTANPPAFSPVYLASGVQSVEFSNTTDGRPLEIVLQLTDGSFDMFDGQGSAYNPASPDEAESQQAVGRPPLRTPPSSGPPDNPEASQ